MGLSTLNGIMSDAPSTRLLASIRWFTSISLAVGSSSPRVGAHGPTILPATKASLQGGTTVVRSTDTRKQLGESG